jgi:hypothetical protein
MTASAIARLRRVLGFTDIRLFFLMLHRSFLVSTHLSPFAAARAARNQAIESFERNCQPSPALTTANEALCSLTGN